ncbi:MAG: hypothetical protein CVU55_13140 [Deltaproteobacteria bacterium HGW-Deltaproteobacteria-13]|jgi:hypothetical protein|nr:MAG: hypothetical protein CVU55_13140 [Deltaproteobacteria bacterium HGW-Deltaproteobacteria-13]
MIEIKRLKTIAALELLTGIGLILFWIGFFTIGLAPENPPPCYFAYEHSFPLPDIILAVALLVSGILLLKNREAGRTLSLVCAGGLMFLGLLDFSFNIQNDIYKTSTLDLALNVFINVWCVIFGLAVAVLISRKPVA